MRPIRVVIADDHALVRRGLRFLLEAEPDLEVAGEAADGREAVALAERLRPDVAVLDIAMPLLNGIDAAAQIARRSPATAVVILSVHADEAYLARALAAGARGYLLKDSAEDDVVRAVRSAAQGRPFFSPRIAQSLLDEYVRQLRDRGVRDSWDLLTEREREVLQLLAEGRTNKEAAALLDLSVHTVETHRTNLMQKLGLHNTAELVLFAVRRGIVS